ncbi:heavy metal-binding domain-containing protein [Lacticaseibacillus kribbianus]|uniref:heavy metal-binding domain-containing protein n=1 Tax=Lacticaseibacillus kribbianus TaxID=2926292 RepID=UPI001CD55199|nr:heavy metal-binding domain-containing protein [Lacticaseibacillus kribbianus]
MKVKELANTNNIPVDQLSGFLKTTKQFQTNFTTFGGLQVRDEDAQSILVSFEQYVENQKVELAEREAAKIAAERAAQQEAIRKQRALAEMLITSGFNFDGYTVVKYSGYISGDDAVQIPRGTDGIFRSATNTGDALMQNLSVIRRRALAELKEQAYALGCNAIIGVDFDYLTLDPQTANSQGAPCISRTFSA